MFCQRCGAALPDGVAYCQVCGNAVAASVPSAPVNNDATIVANDYENSFDATVAAPSASASYQAPGAPVTPLQYAAPQMPAGQPQYAAPQAPIAPPPPQKSNKGLTVAVAVISVIAVAAIALVVLLATGVIGGDDKKEDKEKTTYSQEADIEETKKDKDKNKEEKTTKPSYESTEPSYEYDREENISGNMINRGAVSGNTYTSDYLGLTFTKPYAWSFASDSELAQMNGISEAELNTDVGKYLESHIAFYDMAAMTATGNNNVFVVYESLDVTNSGDISVEEYFENVKNGMDSSGVSYQYGEIETDSLGGETFYSLEAYAITSTIEAYQKLFVVKKDNLMASVVITATSEAEIAEIEAMFS